MITKESSFNELIKAFLKSDAEKKAPFDIEFYSNNPDYPSFYRAEKFLVTLHKKEFLTWLDAWRKLQK